MLTGYFIAIVTAAQMNTKLLTANNSANHSSALGRVKYQMILQLESCVTEAVEFDHT